MRVFYPENETEEVEANTRLVEYHYAMEMIQLGYTTAENMTAGDRFAIQNALSNWPVWDEVVEEDTNTVWMTGTTELREGRDWCFATSTKGYFGVFSLDPALRIYLEGATLHLWPGDYTYLSSDEAIGGRQDYMDLAQYLDEATELTEPAGERNAPAAA